MLRFLESFFEFLYKDSILAFWNDPQGATTVSLFISDVAIPHLNLFVGALMILTFLASALWLIFRNFLLTRQVYKINKRIRLILMDLKDADRQPTNSDVRRLDEIFRGTSFHYPWSEYQESLLRLSGVSPARVSPGESSSDNKTYDKTYEMYYYSTVQCEDYFTWEFVKRKMGEWHSLPGFLTNMGLLMTFISILLGLSKLGIDPATAGKVIGVGELVFNLAGKFYTSITGLALAIAYSCLCDLAQLFVESQFNALRSNVNRVFKARPEQAFLVEIKNEAVQINQHFKEISTVILDSVKEGTAEGFATVLPQFKEVMDGLSKSIELLRAEKSESLGAALAEMSTTINSFFENFGRNLFDITGQSFEQLARKIELLGTRLESIDVSLRSTFERLPFQFESIERAATQLSESISTQFLDNVSKMNSRLEDVSNRFTNLINSILDELRSSFTNSANMLSREIDEVASKSEQKAGMALNVMNKMLEQAERIMNSLNSSISTLEKAANSCQVVVDAVNSYCSSIHLPYEQLQAILRKFEDVSGNIQSSLSIMSNLTTHLNRLQDLVIRREERATKMIEELEGALGKAITEISKALDTYTKTFTEILERLADRCDSLIQESLVDLSEQVNDLAASAEKFNEVFKTQIKFFAAPELRSPKNSSEGISDT